MIGRLSSCGRGTTIRALLPWAREARIRWCFRSRPISWSKELSPALATVVESRHREGHRKFRSVFDALHRAHLTELSDFATQYNHVLDRLIAESDGALETGRMDVFLLTLPYYSSVGYLIDSEDLEYYLQARSGVFRSADVCAGG